MKTKGAILWGVGEEWSVEEIEVGDPVFGEVTVELAASGLCHSDEHLVTGATPVGFPVIGGHEGAGVVTKVGPGVDRPQGGRPRRHRLHPGVRQVPAVFARSAEPLRPRRMHLLGGKADLRRHQPGHRQGPGRLADVPARHLLALHHRATRPRSCRSSRDIPLEIAALVGCGVTTGWGSATKVADVRPGENVVVMGAGGVGMNAVQGAAAAGAKRVIVIDPVGAEARVGDGDRRHPRLRLHGGGHAGRSTSSPGAGWRRRRSSPSATSRARTSPPP